MRIRARSLRSDRGKSAFLEIPLSLVLFTTSNAPDALRAVIGH
jgi:hypothetical protein